MSTENVKISQPVEIQNDAKARVAYDLMTLIARAESAGEQDRKNRDYWLTLYCQCLKAADGQALQYILEKK